MLFDSHAHYDDNRFDAEGIQQAIREAGFTPRLRNQLYELRPWPLDDTLR